MPVSNELNSAPPAPDAASQPVRPPAPFLRIQPTRGWASLNLLDLWRYRDLLYLLALREVQLRYKQTALGVIWVILQPLAAAAIFAVIFGRFARLPSDGVPYLLFAYAGLAGWMYFSAAVNRAGNSLVGQANLITKVYFPRLLIPISSVVSVLVDLAVSMVVLTGMMLAYRVAPTWQLLALPLFLLLITAVATGVSLWLSALGVYYRDFVFAMPFLIQVWMYASPVVYSTSMIPASWHWLFALNPMTGALEGIRWSLLGASALTASMLGISVVSAVLLLVGGLFFFRRVERAFADVI